MTAKLDPTTALLSFDVNPGERLYVSGSGHDVLADCDGAWRYTFSGTADNLRIEVDGYFRTGRTGHCEQYLTISGRPISACRTLLRTGSHPPTVGGDTVELPIHGTGWLMSCASAVRIDGAPHATFCREGEPVPFFQGVFGSGQATVLSAETYESMLLCRVDANDPSSWKRCGFRAQNCSDVFALCSTLDDGAEIDGAVISHLNAAQLEVAIPDNTVGLRLKRLFDRFHGRQRARIMLDGKCVGWWSDVRQDRTHRWGWSERGVEVPADLRGREVTLALDPPAGSPLFSIGVLEVWAVNARS